MDEIWEHILDLFREGSINLNLGCGSYKFTGLTNIDLYRDDSDEKLDARDLSKYQDESVNAIYSSNLLEHFSLSDSEIALMEWSRILRPGGYLILSLPDMKKVIRYCYDWINARWIDQSPDIYKLWESMMMSIYGWQNIGPGQVHQWGYSAEYLTERLEQNGFRKKELYWGYPKRPTPNFTIIAVKMKKEEEENGNN